MNNNFVVTNDVSTKNKLLKMGFILCQKQGSLFVFANNPSISLNKYSDLKVSYTNVFCG